MNLQVKSLDDGGESKTFEWIEKGRWDYDVESDDLTWIFVDDPTPIAVSPQRPASQTHLFTSKDKMTWEAGTYQMTLTADRVARDKPLQATFDVTLSEESADYLVEHAGERWLQVPVEEPVED
jgi:hypothetical protein